MWTHVSQAFQESNNNMFHWVIIKWPRDGGMLFQRSYPKTRAGLGSTEAWIPERKVLGEHSLMAQETCAGEITVLTALQLGSLLSLEFSVCGFL